MKHSFPSNYSGRSVYFHQCSLSRMKGTKLWHTYQHPKRNHKMKSHQTVLSSGVIRDRLCGCGIRDRWHVTDDRWHVTGDRWHVTGDRQHMTCEKWQMTCDTWNVTHNMRHMTSDTWHVTNYTYRSLCSFLIVLLLSISTVLLFWLCYRYHFLQSYYFCLRNCYYFLHFYYF